MILCHDFQKWTMLSLALVAISLSVGILIQVVHGQKVRTFDECVNVYFNGTISPMMPKTEKNFCNFMIEKNLTLDEFKT
jgi:hypothetical protein